TLDVTRYPPYAEVRADPDLVGAYRRNAEELGRHFPDLHEVLEHATASTDMGNVSQVVPTIHPALAIDSGGAVNHQAEFAVACATESADRAAIDGAVAVAWTAVDAAAPGPLRDRLLERSAAGAATGGA